MERILFLTNNFKTTKPLFLWLAKSKKKVTLFSKPLTEKMIQNLNPSLILSYNYRHIIPKQLTQKYKIINLHISYLPYNRGADPNLWAHIENTPSGVTIHYIDEGIDTGDILLQKRVVLPSDLTLSSSYKKLHRHIQQLFKRFYFQKQLIPKKQRGKGSFHLAKEKEKLILPKGYQTTIQELKEQNATRKD